MCTEITEELVVPLSAAIAADAEWKAIVWVNVLKENFSKSATIHLSVAGNESNHFGKLVDEYNDTVMPVGGAWKLGDDIE